MGSSSLVTPPRELSMSIFLDRVVLAVVGGEAGANLGAFGVLATSSIRPVGVERPSSISVTASSSSSAASDLFCLAWFCSGVGKRRRGLMEDRVKGRRRVPGSVGSNPTSSSFSS